MKMGDFQKDDMTSYDDALALKFALESLLGSDEWYRLKDHSGISVWRSSLERALKATRASLLGTVIVADGDWRMEAQRIVQEGFDRIKSAKSIVDLFAAFSATYMQLSFHQLGLMPNLRGRKVNSRAIPSKWNLDTYRTVQYVQSDEQTKRFEKSRNSKLPEA